MPDMPDDKRGTELYDFDAEAQRVCEAIGSTNGRMTVTCALREAYEAGSQVLGARIASVTLEAIDAIKKGNQ